MAATLAAVTTGAITQMLIRIRAPIKTSQAATEYGTIPTSLMKIM